MLSRTSGHKMAVYILVIQLANAPATQTKHITFYLSLYESDHLIVVLEINLKVFVNSRNKCNLPINEYCMNKC